MSEHFVHAQMCDNHLNKLNSQLEIRFIITIST